MSEDEAGNPVIFLSGLFERDRLCSGSTGFGVKRKRGEKDAGIFCVGIVGDGCTCLGTCV